MISWIKKVFQHKHKWKPIRTIWPYPSGWGVYCKSCRTVIDTGLRIEDAQARCDELNGKKPKEK